MLIRLDLPKHLVTSHSILWPSTAPQFVLTECVLEWLEASEIQFSLAYHVYDVIGGSMFSYEIIFQDEKDATLFKLWWL